MSKLEVSWEYYSSHFNKLTEEEFNNLQYEASMIVTRVCRPYVLKAVLGNTEDSRNDFLNDAVCKVTEGMYEQTIHSIGSGVTSVSNDGYSESYAITKREDADKELTTIAKRWLTGTGLVGAL